MDLTIHLRKLKKSDAPLMLEWMNDKEIQSVFRFDAGQKDLQTVVDFIDRADTTLRHEGDIHFAVCDERDEYLGTVSLKKVDLNNKKAEYAISLRKAAHGTGVATEATRQILRLAFEEYGLERVYLNVLSDNMRAIHFYEKFGFLYEGTFRKDLLLRGEYKALNWYSMLKEEYEIAENRSGG